MNSWNSGWGGGAYVGAKTGLEIGGKVYKTVKIGNQEWMAENLDYSPEWCTMVEGQNAVADPFKPCCVYCVTEGYEKTFGLYYNYVAAYRIADSIPGWRLPTMEDWDELSAFVDNAYALQSQNAASFVNATNTTGFSALPGGWIVVNNDDNNWHVSVCSSLNMLFQIATIDDGRPTPDTIKNNLVFSPQINPGPMTSRSFMPKAYMYNVRLIKD